MRFFHPDLILEVTSVCNRACKGCYAPNLLSGKSGEDLFSETPGLFLDPKVWQDLVLSWDQKIPSLISIRGGEPSIHPKLEEIIRSASLLSRNIVIETHGKWIIDESLNTEKILDFLRSGNIELKVSFDSMHGLAVSSLQKITAKLETLNINYSIAITEINLDEFKKVRSLCDWIADEQIIFQKKAINFEDLIKPTIGVVSVQGKIKSKLNSLEVV